MKINLICNKSDNVRIDRLTNFNHVVGWSLRKALRKRGVDCHLVKDTVLKTKIPPKADHNIVISGIGMRLIRDNLECKERLESATTGKTALLLDSDFGKWNRLFDCVFTIIKPKLRKPRYFYAGWGADPEYFYPEQEEKAIYVDSLDCLIHDKHKGRFMHIFKAYRSVLRKTDLTLHCPIPGYNTRFVPTYWPRIQQIMRKCHFYCCTQFGDSGLTRIEAATCGALLVVPEELYRPRTMASLEYRTWSNKKELTEIFEMETNPYAIREKALKHSWDKVADRVLRVLESKLD